MASKLILEKKIEELLNKEVYPMLKLFPKAEKFALCHEIKHAFYQFLKCIMLANNVKAKRKLFIEEAEGYHKLILVLFSVACEQRYINHKKLLRLQAAMFEMGKMLGGWLKSA